jgi:hypothetical protein
MKENPLLRLEALGQSVWMGFHPSRPDVGKGFCLEPERVKPHYEYQNYKIGMVGLGAWDNLLLQHGGSRLSAGCMGDVSKVAVRREAQHRHPARNRIEFVSCSARAVMMLVPASSMR